MGIQRTGRNFQGNFCSCLLFPSVPFLLTAAQTQELRDWEQTWPQSHGISAPLPKAQPGTGSSRRRSISSSHFQELLHAPLLLGSTTAPLECCTNHSTHGEVTGDMDGDKHHSPTFSFPSSFSTCLMAKNDCCFSGYFPQF